MRDGGSPITPLDGALRRPMAPSGLRAFPHQLEAYHALVLAGGFASGVRIDAALPRFAQVAGRERGARHRVDLLAAVLLHEHAVDRCFAVLQRQVLALPAVAAEARSQEIA